MLEYQLKTSKEFKLEISSSSCYLSDIKSFVYGPFTSRFWMMRKHLMLTDKSKLKRDAPFYAWDCITLQMKAHPDVYLVIKNEKVMTHFLKLLIYKLETIDGNRGSAIPLRNVIVKDQTKELRKK